MNVKEMTASERIRARIKGEEVDRLPVLEWAPWWNLTLDRWQEEGLPSAYGLEEIQKYFGLDLCMQTYFSSLTARTPQPTGFGRGITPDEESYEKIKSTLYPDPATLYSKEYFELCRKRQERGDTIQFFTVEGFFWFPRTLMGIEPHLYSFYDEPEFYHQICRDQCDFIRRTIEVVGNSFRFDFMSFAEDMSYNLGPMVSEEMFSEFLAPYYRELIPLLKKLDIPVFIDSDGDVTKALDWYAAVGIDGMFPLERKAGVDVSLYVKKHPEIAYLGHFDKMCMKNGEDAMRQEFARLAPSVKKGRVIPSVDHQTPPDVSLENYRIYMRLYREFAETILN